MGGFFVLDHPLMVDGEAVVDVLAEVESAILARSASEWKLRRPFASPLTRSPKPAQHDNA